LRPFLFAMVAILNPKLLPKYKNPQLEPSFWLYHVYSRASLLCYPTMCYNKLAFWNFQAAIQHFY
jgi:hypothetical protein